jgi:hypothetical protein
MSDSQRRKLHPMNDYTTTHPRTRGTFVLENWGDYKVAELLRFLLPDKVWKKFPDKATVRITVEHVRPLTAPIRFTSARSAGSARM